MPSHALIDGALTHHPGRIALIALLAMGVELLADLPDLDRTHDLKETAASLTIAVLNKTVAYLTAGLSAAPLVFLYQFRLFDIPADKAWALIAAFVLTDFSYYWHHYAMHRIRLLWASHRVHHSPTRLNLTAAVRLGVGGHLVGGFLFYAPLVLLGFPPVVVFAMLGLGLAYQLFLHPARAPGLGPLEWVLNTPRHHQVHHASNGACLDKNFGGVFILFDRLFGTFAPAPRSEPLKFGLAGAPDRPSRNPLRILFGEWGAIVRDLRAARSPAAAWRAVTEMRAGPHKG